MLQLARALRKSRLPMLRTVVLLMMAGGTAACGGSQSSPARATPTAPSPTPTPQVVLAVFRDPASTFSTSDVRDVQEQIVRFDTAANSLIWVVDGRSFSGYSVDGNFIANRFFQVRFGTKNGERRAYFTETATATICDIEVNGGQLLITGTNVTVPNP